MSIRRQTIWNLIPMVVMTVFSLLSVRIMYNGLGAEMYALLLYVYTMTGTFGFIDLGIGTALARYMGIALGEGNQQAIKEYWTVGVCVGVAFTAFFSLIFILVGIFGGPLWFNVAPENKAMLRWCFAVGGMSLFLSYVAELWNRACQVYLDFSFVSKVRIAFFLLQIIPAMYLAWQFGKPVYLLLWAVIVSALQFAVVISHVARKYDLHVIPKEAFRRARFDEMKLYMMKSFSALLVGNFFVGLDRIVLGRLAAPAPFASYGIAYNAGQRAESLSTSFISPVFSNMNLLLKKKEGLATPASVYNYTCSMVLNWLLLAVVIVAFFSKPLLSVWLGTELAQAVHPVFIPVVLGCCINAFANLSRVALTSIDRQGILIKTTIFSGVAAAVCCYLGFRLHGIVGAAGGFLVSKLLYIIMDLKTVRILGARGVYDLKTALKICAFIFAGWVASYLLKLLPDRSHLWLILAGLALCSGCLIFKESRKVAFSAM